MVSWKWDVTFKIKVSINVMDMKCNVWVCDYQSSLIRLPYISRYPGIVNGTKFYVYWIQNLSRCVLVLRVLDLGPKYFFLQFFWIDLFFGKRKLLYL